MKVEVTIRDEKIHITVCMCYMEERERARSEQERGHLVVTNLYSSTGSGSKIGDICPGDRRSSPNGIGAKRRGRRDRTEIETAMGNE